MSAADILLEWTEKLVQTDFACLADFSAFDEFRNRYKAVMAPGQEFYELWLKEVVLSANFSQMTNLVHDFVDQYPVFDIAASVMDVIMKFYEEDLVEDANAIRQLLETILAYCGSDIMTGALLWQKLIDFELEEHEGLLEIINLQTQSADLRHSKERLYRACERQLSLPLIGNDTALTRLETILSEHYTNDDITLIRPDLLTQKITLATTLRDDRLLFEQQLFLDPNTTSNYQNTTFTSHPKTRNFEEYLQVFKTYIHYEIQEKEYARVERLFLRLINSNFSTFSTQNNSQSSAQIDEKNSLENEKICVKLVEFFLRFVVFTYAQLKRPEKTDNIITKRLFLHENEHIRTASRKCVWLHKFRLLAQEQLFLIRVPDRNTGEKTSTKNEAKISENSSKIQTENLSENSWLQVIQSQLLPETLHSGFVGAEDYLEFFLTCLSSIHRHYLATTSSSTVVEEVATFISQLGEMMVTYFPTWSEGQLTFRRQCAHILLSITNHHAPQIGSQKGGRMELQAVKQQFESLVQLYPDQYWVYHEMITFYTSHGLCAQGSAVYRRIIHIKHWQDGITTSNTVLKAWLRYEEDYASTTTGDNEGLEGLKGCLVKHTELFVQMAMASLYASTTSQQQQLAASSNSKSSKGDSSKKRGREDDNNNQPQQAQSSSTSSKKLNNSTEEDGNQAAKKPRTVTFNADQAEKQPAAALAQATTAAVVPTGLQIALRNLHYNFTAKELELMLKSKQLSFKSTQLMRGLAVITLRPADRDTADPHAVLQHWQSSLHDATSRGRPVEISIATPHDHQLLADKAKEQIPQKTTVFISRLPVSIDNEEKLQNLFAVYGTITACKLAVDKVTSISKGTALVEYAQEEGRNAALKAHKVLEVDGQIVSVTVSKFPVQTPAPPAATAGTDTAMDVAEDAHEDAAKEVKSKDEAAKKKDVARSSNTKVTAFRPRGVAMKPKLQL